jgi:hypothetical protein
MDAIDAVDRTDDAELLRCRTYSRGFINNDLKYRWYEYMKTFNKQNVGKMATIPQCDSHASNCSMKLSHYHDVD